MNKLYGLFRIYKKSDVESDISNGLSPKLFYDLRNMGNDYLFELVDIRNNIDDLIRYITTCPKDDLQISVIELHKINIEFGINIPSLGFKTGKPSEL